MALSRSSERYKAFLKIEPNACIVIWAPVWKVKVEINVKKRGV